MRWLGSRYEINISKINIQGMKRKTEKWRNGK